jgi:hypothetical protein
MSERFTAPPAPSIDVSRLPADVVELIDTLGPGGSLVITRGGISIAKITLARDALEGVIVTPRAQEESAQQPPTTNENAIVVASALKLSAEVRGLLSDQLGEDYVVLDFDDAPPTADVLLVGPVSLQLIGRLRSMFPRARVMVAEFEDEDLGIKTRGSVRRLIDAGAETYLVSSTLSGLATQLNQAVAQRAQLTGGTPVRLEIEADPTTPTT